MPDQRRVNVLRLTGSIEQTAWQNAYISHLCATREVIARTVRQAHAFVAMV
jgi:hypothetical protein